MSLTKINETDFEFSTEYYESIYDSYQSVIDLQFTKDGLEVGNETITWEEIAKAREVLNLVSFDDEEHEQWQKEQENK